MGLRDNRSSGLGGRAQERAKVRRFLWLQKELGDDPQLTASSDYGPVERWCTPVTVSTHVLSGRL